MPNLIRTGAQNILKVNGPLQKAIAEATLKPNEFVGLRFEQTQTFSALDSVVMMDSDTFMEFGYYNHVTRSHLISLYRKKDGLFHKASEFEAPIPSGIICALSSSKALLLWNESQSGKYSLCGTVLTLSGDHIQIGEIQVLKESDYFNIIKVIKKSEDEALVILSKSLILLNVQGEDISVTAQMDTERYINNCNCCFVQDQIFYAEQDSISVSEGMDAVIKLYRVEINADLLEAKLVTEIMGSSGQFAMAPVGDNQVCVYYLKYKKLFATVVNLADGSVSMTQHIPVGAIRWAEDAVVLSDNHILCMFKRYDKLSDATFAFAVLSYENGSFKILNYYKFNPKAFATSFLGIHDQWAAFVVPIDDYTNDIHTTDICMSKVEDGQLKFVAYQTNQADRTGIVRTAAEKGSDVWVALQG